MKETHQLIEIKIKKEVNVVTLISADSVRSAQVDKSPLVFYFTSSIVLTAGSSSWIKEAKNKVQLM